ncbi:acyltransferase domain-containing protein [Streptomyces sp. NPDC091281]|uniref:acyltransferase domain-containing protein n=1 Tax=Streptomyces sp. NPDC091281 TaxID=3365985 RepID=UPI0037F5B33C
MTGGTAPAHTRHEADPAAVRRWLAGLRGQPAGRVPDPVPPSPTGLRQRLALLAVPEADRERLCAEMPGPDRDPAVWEALIRCHQRLFAAPADGADSAEGTDGADGTAALDWPDAPAALGATGRYFYAHLFVLALPLALERQHRLGVPDDVVGATFADLGAKLTSYRLAHGTGGFDRQRWIARHFRGTLHRLGRLQFDRAVLDADAHGGDAAASGGPAHGDPVLQVHIPGDGPLSRSACDASFAAARHFYARHFPATRHARATCSSWLLDPQLAEHLAPESRILAFQSRFARFGARPVCDDDVLEFVFHRPPGRADLGRLPQGTALQRSLVRHLRAGGHWHLAHGWTALP